LEAIAPSHNFSRFFNYFFLLILPLCATFSNGSRVGWSAGTSETILKLDTLRMIVAKLGSYWFSGFREEDFLKSLQTDDGRMPIAHMAFWPGDLKRINITKTMKMESRLGD
jgi:hypothetical protein